MSARATRGRAVAVSGSFCQSATGKDPATFGSASPPSPRGPPTCATACEWGTPDPVLSRARQGGSFSRVLVEVEWSGTTTTLVAAARQFHHQSPWSLPPTTATTT